MGTYSDFPQCCKVKPKIRKTCDSHMDQSVGRIWRLLLSDWSTWLPWFSDISATSWKVPVNLQAKPVLLNRFRGAIKWLPEETIVDRFGANVRRKRWSGKDWLLFLTQAANAASYFVSFDQRRSPPWFRAILLLSVLKALKSYSHRLYSSYPSYRRFSSLSTAANRHETSERSVAPILSSQLID